MQIEKKHFDIDQAANNQSDLRQAQALEFIAHYLELIEGHLARALNPGPSDSPVEKIGSHLASIAHLVGSIATNQGK